MPQETKENGQAFESAVYGSVSRSVKKTLVRYRTVSGRDCVKTLIPPASAAWPGNFNLMARRLSSVDATDFSRVEIQLLPVITSSKPEADTSTRLKVGGLRNNIYLACFRQKLKYHAAEAGGVRVFTQSRYPS